MFPSGSVNNNSHTNNKNINNNNNNIVNGNVVDNRNPNKMSPSSSGITTPTRISIKEANDHLQLLHSRVSELEEIIRHQSDQSVEQEEIYMRQLKELKSAKEAQIDELTKTIVLLEERIKDLEIEVKMKSDKLEEGQSRLALLDDVTSKWIPNLQELMVAMKRLASPGVNNDTDELLNVKESNNSSAIGLIQEINGSSTYSSIMVDSSAQTDLTGIYELPVKSDILNISVGAVTGNGVIAADVNGSGSGTSGGSSVSGLSISEPSYSKRSSIDDTTSHREKVSPEERVISVPGDGIESTQWISEKNVKSSRRDRPRRVRKSVSSVNCQYIASPNRGKDYFTDPSSTISPNTMPMSRSFGSKIHSNNSSHNITGKIEKSFSITSNFSEDEDFPVSNGSRGYHK